MKTKVLIIDDEPDLRLYYQTLLSEHGYEAQVESDGDTGFETAGSFGPDVITLDIMMDRETGVKCYRRICSDPELKKVPVIVVSGATSYRALFGRDHATMPKPFAFIEKPIDETDFLLTVGEAAALSRSYHGK